jgi:hypothetical protein
MLHEGPGELLGLVARAVGDFLEAVPQGLGARRDGGLVVPATVPGTILVPVEGGSVKLNAEAKRLVVVVEVPDSVGAGAPSLASSRWQAMGTLDIGDPAALQWEVDAVTHVDHRILQPGPPGKPLPVPEDVVDHPGRDFLSRDCAR